MSEVRTDPHIIFFMDSWMATSTTNAPDARYSPTAVWTGIQMIVWGGTNDAQNSIQAGGIVRNLGRRPLQLRRLHQR